MKCSRLFKWTQYFITHIRRYHIRNDDIYEKLNWYPSRKSLCNIVWDNLDVCNKDLKDLSIMRKLALHMREWKLAVPKNMILSCYCFYVIFFLCFYLHLFTFLYFSFLLSFPFFCLIFYYPFFLFFTFIFVSVL
jgi:hypothetical protein